MKIQNKTIVVTGGGNGMGRELVLELLRKNARVIAIDLNPQALEETKNLAGKNTNSLYTFVLDITDKNGVEKTASEIISLVETVDGIINNAGIIQPFTDVKELKQETIERIMNVNFWGLLHITKAFLPHLLQRPEAHIVNISSMGGFIPFPGQTIYGASKAAVKLFTEGLHSELKDSSVNVTVVHPGAVATNIINNSGLESPKIDGDISKNKMVLSASKAAQIIIRGMEKNKYRVLVGKDAKLLDFLYRLNPKFASNFIQKMMKKM